MVPSLSSQVDQIKTQILELQKQLDKIQTSCNHPREGVIIKNLNPMGTSHIRKICGTCGAAVGFPNSTEIKKWGFK
jgi:hypothetical protein